MRGSFSQQSPQKPSSSKPLSAVRQPAQAQGRKNRRALSFKRVRIGTPLRGARRRNIHATHFIPPPNPKKFARRLRGQTGACELKTLKLDREQAVELIVIETSERAVLILRKGISPPHRKADIGGQLVIFARRERIGVRVILQRAQAGALLRIGQGVGRADAVGEDEQIAERKPQTRRQEQIRVYLQGRRAGRQIRRGQTRGVGRFLNALVVFGR